MASGAEEAPPRPHEGISANPEATRLAGKAAGAFAGVMGRTPKREGRERVVYAEPGAIATALVRLAQAGKRAGFVALCGAAPEGACEKALERVRKLTRASNVRAPRRAPAPRKPGGS